MYCTVIAGIPYRRAAKRATSIQTLSKNFRRSSFVEENTPEGLHKIVPEIVERIDAIVGEVAYTGWTSSDSGDKSVRRELRAVLRNYSLPVKGELFDRIYQYVRENY